MDEYSLRLAKGNIQSHRIVNKFGRNADVDLAAAEEVWATGGLRTYLAAAETLDIVSTDAADAGAGTGARTVLLEGCDASFEEITEIVTLAGLTPVVTTQAFIRLNRVFVVTTGTGLENAGIITIDPTSSGSGARQCTIAAGDGQSLIGHYLIPVSHSVYMISMHTSIAAAAGGASKQGNFRLFYRPTGGAWRIQNDFRQRSDGSPSPDLANGVPTKYETGDLKWIVSVDADDTAAFVQYSMILVND